MRMLIFSAHSNVDTNAYTAADARTNTGANAKIKAIGH